MQFISNSADKELDFYIKGVKSFTLFGQKIWITTTHLSILYISLALIIFAIIVNRRFKHAEMIPGKFQNAVEMIVDFIQNLVHSNMKRGDGYFNYIGMVFLFVIVSNLSGLIGLRAPTADYAVTFTIGITTFFIIQITGFKNKGLDYIKGMAEPSPVLFPINLIGEIATPVSLSMRLFANMLAGTIIMALWYGLMPIFVKLGIPSFLHAYLDVFSGCIQTYVMCLLTSIYIDDKM